MGPVIVISITLICWTALAIQWSQYYIRKAEREFVNESQLTEELTQKLTQLDDLKRQVDVLNLRAGFSR